MSPDYPFDDAATARAVIDDLGTVREWNGGAERLLGHPAPDVVGHPAANLLVSDGPDPAFAPGGPRWDGTVTLRHRDGGTVSVWLLAHHRRSRDGSPGQWLVVTPLEVTGSQDGPLATAALVQSPCAVAVYDERLRLSRVNDAMAEVIGLPEERIRGLRLSEIGGKPESAELERHLLRVLASGRAEDVQTYMRTGGERAAHAWLARMAPVTDAEGRVRGVCLAAHDFTENYLARERLQLVNEASVRIGSTLDVTRTAQELADVCVPALADFVSIDLLDPQENGDPPPVLTAPVGLRRAAHQSVNPGTPEAVVKPGQLEPYPATSPQADSLVAGGTIVATVASGELDQWLTWDPARSERVREYGIHSTMSVPIQARGLTLGVAVLTRFRRPDPFTPDDVLLAEEVTARAAVCIDNARRFSRERETALALQRSLLPRKLPRTAAVDAASRYLPAARAGVGGDWFDVIPLSGMRVAMVVGDVVGHGIQASATMGRLRTAVRTLADIDLAPDELLTHLDDLVVRLSAEAGGEGSPGEVGATCLYAVYDPVSRRCTLARAGHPAPVMITPGAAPQLVDLPSGPPLGVGGLPFESAELELREGTVLSFFTDGLIESRERDADAGHALLRESLSVASESLEETCDRVLHTLLPAGGSADDVALLLARTRGLPAAQVATWHIPADPALVGPIRKQVVDQLGTWDLLEASFTAELVVSELVTNAIRYGAHPIRLRLIHDETTLICEVSDTNHTAPHLRRAKTWDEGGRGLLLVAQLTQRWGSRHTTEGKTIWAEIGLLEEDD
ncbi:SpoIIE family protein phosphatase [Streptomyces sp. NBC_00140]|uniref:SpoIIE family protein phosphatase n=1 Tax=Streptomyces sp. NBC_00140 TaxID=2975664 RepID=UPI002252DA10|nr:SpoIIE family protein phosphatase [Streptomyces sp. NBC_00140]MCX5329478.1 SpoIIE family protein phosphatase [Streptomyces sp. NBC_00140]